MNIFKNKNYDDGDVMILDNDDIEIKFHKIINEIDRSLIQIENFHYSKSKTYQKYSAQITFIKTRLLNLKTRANGYDIDKNLLNEAKQLRDNARLILNTFYVAKESFDDILYDNSILIEEDVMILDNEFFKINTMFETVNKMYDIKMRELEYNYVYTESINEEYVDLYTEAEAAKSEKQQGLLGRLFTAILNFIRSIRAKILRLFGNDKKAAELEAKIKGNPKLANQTVEITNTTDAEKAIEEGTGFFAGLIDKIAGGTATEADADAAEEKGKSLLARIGIFGAEAGVGYAAGKVVGKKLKEHGVTKQVIKETVSNLFKREEDTKKKSNEVTQTNEQNVQKARQALNNNSQSGNEENTKAGKRIINSLKEFISGAGKFFTGKASELKSKITGVFSNNNDDNKGDNEQQTSVVQKKTEERIDDNANLSTLENRILSKFQQDDIPSKYVDKANSIKSINSEPDKANAIMALIDDVVKNKEEIKKHYMNYYDNFIKTNKDGSAKSLLPNGLSDAERRFNTYINTLSNAKGKLSKKINNSGNQKNQHIMNRLQSEIEGMSEASTISTRLGPTKRGETIFSIEKRKTFKESSYDLINDILTIFENSF